MHRRRYGKLRRFLFPSTYDLVKRKDFREFWTKLMEGAVWIDEPTRQTKIGTFTFGLTNVPDKQIPSEGIQLIAYGWRGATSTAQVSPILSKVFQETELRNVNGIVSLNPTTARQLGLSKGEPATLSTKNGSMNVRIKIESTVRPGTAEASIAPLPNGIETPLNPAGNNILNLCEVTNDGTWRITTANLLKV